MSGRFDRDIIEHLPNAYAYHKIVLDNGGNPVDYIFIDINRAFEKNTGLLRDNIIGKNVTEVMPGIKDSDFEWISIYGRVALRGESIRMVEHSQELNRWYSVTAYSNEEGYFTTIFDDITIEKETEFKLREKERELKEAHSIAKLGRWDFYHRESRLEWSDTIFDIFGKSRDSFKVTYENFLDIIHPSDRYAVNKAWEDSLISQEAYNIEHRLIMDNGHIKWLKEDCRTEFDNEGMPLHSIGVVQDITDIKMAQEKLALKQIELDTFFTSSLDLLSIANKEGVFLRLNPEWENALGYPINELTGKNILDFVHTEDMEITLDGLYMSRNQGNIRTFINRYRCINGNYKWLEWRLKSVGNLLYISTRDISVHIEMQKMLSEQEKKYRLVAEGIADVVWTSDLQFNVTFISPSIEKLTQETAEEAIGKAVYERFKKEDTEKLLEVFRQEMEIEKDPHSDKQRSVEMQLQRRKKDNSFIWVSMKMTFLRDAEGRPIGVHGVTRDISARKKIEFEKDKKQREIEYLSFYDHLTKLYNRRFFELELARLDSKENLPLSIIIGDVNGLKILNDSLGHDVGDELLIRTANILKRSSRSEDIVARIGGDEFAILLPRTETYIAEKIIKRVKNASKMEKVKGINVSIALGSGTKHINSEDIEDIKKVAEDRMYDNKFFDNKQAKKDAINEIMSIIDIQYPEEKDYLKRILRLYEKISNKK